MTRGKTALLLLLWLALSPWRAASLPSASGTWRGSEGILLSIEARGDGLVLGLGWDPELIAMEGAEIHGEDYLRLWLAPAPDGPSWKGQVRLRPRTPGQGIKERTIELELFPKDGGAYLLVLAAVSPLRLGQGGTREVVLVPIDGGSRNGPTRTLPSGKYTIPGRTGTVEITPGPGTLTIRPHSGNLEAILEGLGLSVTALHPLEGGKAWSGTLSTPRGVQLPLLLSLGEGGSLHLRAGAWPLAVTRDFVRAP